jgi:hypothetical protein
MTDWNIDNTRRHYSDLTIHAFGQAGAYAEVSNVRGTKSTQLRIFCKGSVKEPLFALITNSSLFTGVSATTPQESVNFARRIINGLTMNFEFGSVKRDHLTFEIVEMQGDPQPDATVRVSTVIRVPGMTREDADKLTRVSLTDAGQLGRADWTFQDIVKFRIQGDRRLIRLAMRNCT